MLRNEKGISLIELMAAVTITVIIIGAISTVIYQSNLGFTTITSRESVQDEARLITENVVNEIRSQPYVISQVNNTELQLRNSTSGDFVHYTFDRPNFRLDRRKDNVATTLVLSKQVDDAQFFLTNNDKKIRLLIKFQNTNIKPYETTIQVPVWNQN